MNWKDAVNYLSTIAVPLTKRNDLKSLIDNAERSRVILLGEASHGTHEYYLWRAEITKELIRKRQCSFVAVEGDWPECYRLNRYVKGYPNSGESALDVLRSFNRWPTWMWANWEMVAFAEWLRKHNSTLPIAERVGFYGLDMYSLSESLEAVIAYLQEKDPDSVITAREALRCFEQVGGRTGATYASTAPFVPDTCEDEVVLLLQTIQSRAQAYDKDEEGIFSAEQNALIAVHAEEYYRKLMLLEAESWNVRDMHMAETLSRLLRFHGAESHAVVWEHNTHVGDARATDMVREGAVNVGQLAREEFGEEAVLIVGFGSHSGSVIASQYWGGPIEKMPVPDARLNSWETLLHEMGKNVLIPTAALKKKAFFTTPIEHRAIGVVYNPKNEYGNYVPSNIPDRYDFFIYFDRSEALHPLHIAAKEGEMPQTYPWGI